MQKSRSDLVVIAKVKAKPGKESGVKEAIEECAVPTRIQPGYVSFSLLHSTEDPSTYIGLERWASAKDHDRHLQGAHVQKLMARMADILAEPPSIITYEVANE